MVSESELRVLLPAKPKDDLGDVSRLLKAVLPPGRTHVRRLYVHRPVESDFFIPESYARLQGISRLEFEAEIATRAETEEEMKALMARGFAASADVVRGSPAEEILREASFWRADLVAVRTRSAAARDSRIGGMASALMGHATCPVLTHHAVPEGYRVRRILIPVDFSKASRWSVDWGLAIAEITGAEPVLLHVVARWKGRHGVDQDELVAVAREELDRWRDRVPSTLSRLAPQASVVAAATTAEGIVSFAEEGGHDLIVLSATGASAMRAILLGSNTRKVVRASKSPVLVIPASNRVTAEDFLEIARGVPKPARSEGEARAATLAAGARA